MPSENDPTIFEGKISKSFSIRLKGDLIINSSIEKAAAIFDNSSLKPKKITEKKIFPKVVLKDMLT